MYVVYTVFKRQNTIKSLQHTVYKSGIEDDTRLLYFTKKKKIELRQSKSNKNAAVTRPFVVSEMKKDGCAKRFIVDHQGGDSPLV